MAEVLSGDLAEVADRAHAGGQRLVIRHDHPALARGDDLVRVEAEAADVAESAHPASLVRGAGRLGGVLDHRKPRRPRQLEERIHVHRVAEEMHRKDRLGAGRDALGHLGHIDVVRLRVDVREHRAGALEQDGIRGGDAGQRCRDHFVVHADVEAEERHVQRRGAGIRRDGVTGPAQAGEGRLELPHLRALGDPPAFHDLVHGPHLVGSDVRPRHRNAPGHWSRCPRPSSVGRLGLFAQAGHWSRCPRPTSVGRLGLFAQALIGCPRRCPRAGPRARPRPAPGRCPTAG